MAGMLSMMQLIIIQFVGWLGWPSGIALAQLEFSDTLTGTASITDLGIACLMNTAVFITSFLRGRLYLEMGARDVMATITGPALKEISDVDGLSIPENYKAADVVMLSSDLSNPSTRLFMKYMFNTHDVYSILLKYVSLETAIKDPSIILGLETALKDSSIILGKLSPVNCSRMSVNCKHKCSCIVFRTKDEITKVLVTGIPKTLKALSKSHCLLPCQKCRVNRCHGCNQGLLYLDDSKELRTCNQEEVESSKVESSAVRVALDKNFEGDNEEEHTCICVPLKPKPKDDDWTKVLVKFLKSKDEEAIGARVKASIVLESYLSMKGESDHEERDDAAKYYNPSTFIVPRLVEILINLVLTCWLKLDGFSSAMVARKAVRNHIVDSTGNGFAANAFLTAVHVNYYVSNNSVPTVCQKLRFRGGTFLNLKTWFRSGTFLNLKTLSFVVGFVNVICSLGWALSIALGGDHAPKSYRIPSMPPSIPRLAVIMAAICIGFGMDCIDLCSIYKINRSWSWSRSRSLDILVVVMILEMMCILSGLAVAGTLDIKGIGSWVYSALQILVWVKWGVGCYLLGQYSPEYAQTNAVAYDTGGWVDVGAMVYSSSFMLNAVLAGVRGWKLKS